MHQPHIVMVQESWLNKSIEEVHIDGYKMLSRRDRHENENRGGVICFVRLDFQDVVFISESQQAERLWHFLHLDIGTVVLANWYRPPSASEEHL